MIIKSHLCGIAVAYEPKTLRKNNEPKQTTSRYQGSLYSQQKKAIANATEWIRQNALYKPRIFVATSPGFLNHANEANFISKLCHNLRNGYDCKHYVWVREYTGNGYPHFHFVADIDNFDAVRLSLTWSGYFGETAKNSIRLGTRPNKQGKRKFWLSSSRQCWYLTKYLGKSIGQPEKGALKNKPVRTFGISQIARKESEPLIYEAKITKLFTGLHSRQFELIPDQIDEGIPIVFNTASKHWKWTGHGQTYVGTPKTWKSQP
jgi:hypothetical protein